MDPKSCRQTPHWIIAMICSLSCYFDFQYATCFVLSKCVFELIVSCFVEDCFNSWEGSDKRQHQGFIQLEPCSAKAEESFLKHNVEYCPNLCVTFLCASLETLTSVLNIAAGALFEELLCVWRWRWCWGGAALVAESHGWKEGGYFNVQKGQHSPLLQTHTWQRSLQVSVFSFTLKHNGREVSSVQSGCPFPLASGSVRKCLSANHISKRKKRRSYRCQPSENDRLGSENIAHTVD